MIDYEKKASVFFEKNIAISKKKVISNKLPCVVLNFSEIELSEEETIKVQSVLKEGSFQRDVNELLDLTCQIKAIQKQGIILIGEKIFRAREIINKSPSRKTSFSSWLNMFFKTKSSAYNALSYYELYIQLSNDQLKEIFLEIPYKAAYKLSSKKISLQKKEELIPHLIGLSNYEIISAIDDLMTYSKNHAEQQDSLLFSRIRSKLNSILDDVDTKFILSSKNKKEIIQILRLIEFKLNS